MTGNRSGDSDSDTSEDKKDVESSLENETGDNPNSGMFCFQSLVLNYGSYYTQ